MEVDWAAITGHGNEIRELKTLLAEGRLPHALLFTGKAGIGKKLVGQILAAAILCGHENAPCGVCDNCRAMAAGTHPDYYELLPEVRGRSNRIIRIEAIREMQTVVSRSAVQAGRRVVLIDDADTMNEPAANSLLKTLEEPEGQVTFILLAHDRSSLLDTIVSRCMPMSFGTLTVEEMKAELSRRQVPGNLVEKLATLADGSLGQALQLSARGGLELRDDALRFLDQLPELTMTQVWKEAAAMGEMEQEKLSEWVQYFNMLLRDMLLLYADGASPLLYNDDLRAQLAGRLAQFSPEQLFAMLAETREITRRLQANVNLRLQLEGFFIRLKDCC
ncbi:DNA polymerase-3 subunit delta' [Selenomonas ruminantium]|uniref:DNA polymerase-3 subunit delta n=1 Tax=Selenomonas ruminantium TaxID=971 RepID=A0A1M6T3G0_SELRU|nr:DNA polymerase III subunit delta' [Selenomonas ruminantium]SHK51338.1 DNA polymerase-3 subunit delta' [Selenomonas ruminantium]